MTPDLLLDRIGPEVPRTILVVDDEVLIRLEISDYLRDCGFRVIEAAQADEAVAVLSASEPIDLVFTDIHMPGSMDGFGLARWIRDNRPDVKVLLTSGLARTTELASDLCGLGPVEPKPMSRDALLRRIRRLLDRAAEG